MPHKANKKIHPRRRGLGESWMTAHTIVVISFLRIRHFLFLRLGIEEKSKETETK